MARLRILIVTAAIALCFGLCATRSFADDELGAAVTAFDLRQFDQVIAIANHMLTRGASVEALFLRGSAQAAEGRRSGAIGDLTQARDLAITTNDPMASTLDKRLAALLIDSGALEPALRIYAEAKAAGRTTLDLDSLISTTLEARAGMAVRLARPAEAASWLERGGDLVVTRSAELYAEAAQTLIRAPVIDWSRAEWDADRALLCDPFAARAHYVEAEAQLRRGDRSGGLARLVFAASLSRGDIELSQAIDAALGSLTGSGGLPDTAAPASH